MCKLNIGKAYDHVNWVFHVRILQQMEFGRKWVSWVKLCITTVKFTIVINGAPELFFVSQRGQRQGDPLSPFLFIITMEGLNDTYKENGSLNNILRTVHRNGWICGFNVAQNHEERVELLICSMLITLYFFVMLKIVN